LHGGLDQRCVIYVVRNIIPPDVCQQFTKNFWNLLQHTGNNRDDYVQVVQIGANQFEKSTSEYFEQICETRAVVDALFEGLDGEGREAILVEKLLKRLCKRRGITFRAAQFNGVTVNPCTARSWQNEDEFSLLPHEDLAQLSRAQVDGFDIGTVTHVITATACMSSGWGGNLVLWDIAPDQEARTDFGLTGTGYGYPLSSLAECDRLEIDLAPGDMFFLSSDFIHAVTSVTMGQRVTTGRFIGFTDDQTLVYWS
jgi:hypothetical protein